MNILFAASEAAPFAKTGGLADVAGSLPPALAKLGHKVSVVIPRYRLVNVDTFGLKYLTSFYVPVGTWRERCDVLQGVMPGNVTAYFINKDRYFDRPELYRTALGDYPDNAERFIFFSRAALELCLALDLRPDIVHCNDWQTGLMPLYLDKIYSGSPQLRRTRSVFTVHNLGYQGLFWHLDMNLTGLGWEVFTPEGIEFWGRINLLKAGLVFSDIITTVSRTYSREIQTPEFGYGLEGVLRKRSKDLYGIVNGIDPALWNPARDGAIASTFSAARPAGKAACKSALLQRLGLPDTDDPLVGMVGRLVDQKGLDIVTEALPDILSLGARVVVLGTGEEKYERILSDAAARYPDRLRALFHYDDDLARNIYAGSDLFLMPSRYEPCGLSQMIALRYGTVPVVRKTGGLADTVPAFNVKTGSGIGFVFADYSARALLECLRLALGVFGDKKRWKRLMEQGMSRDFSWERSAKEYMKVYRMAMRKARP